MFALRLKRLGVVPEAAHAGFVERSKPPGSNREIVRSPRRECEARGARIALEAGLSEASGRYIVILGAAR
jgi:hypothetical protein